MNSGGPNPRAITASNRIGRHERLDIRTDHRDPIAPAEPANDTLEKVRAFCSTVEQGHLQIGQIMGDDQARHPAAGTQVEHGLDVSVRSQRSDEPASVVNDVRNRSSTEETETLRVEERSQQWRGGRAAHHE